MDADQKMRAQMTPAEFYKAMRPEFFSDSVMEETPLLTRELLFFELEKISTNQKENQFETFCRRLAELFIAPNLIPQVGPTGGGDGKTDSETHPISQELLFRWFIPENGWNNNEQWAFAISAKAQWKSKLKSDIASITSTKRGYTHVFFMTNQKLSSKKKKDAQDEFSAKFKICITILDAEWAIEKIFTHNLLELAVNSLGMSPQLIPQKKVGPIDLSRNNELDEINQKLSSSSRYSTNDFQLFEDSLSVAILARELERSQEEVDGYFARAIRFANRRNDITQLRRGYYQLAWTHMMYYADYNAFADDYFKFKQYNAKIDSVNELELYFTLFTLLYQIQNQINLKTLNIDIQQEQEEIKTFMQGLKSNTSAHNLSLLAEAFLVFTEILNSVSSKVDCSDKFNELIAIFKKTHCFLDFPFNTLAKMVKHGLSMILFDNKKFDLLLDVVAELEGERNSRYTAGVTYYNRALIKIEHDNYRDGIVYLGRALMKFAKDDSKDDFIRCLMCLGTCYRELGLLWASNNVLVIAFNVSMSIWLRQKNEYFLKTMIWSIKEIIANELSIGRLPMFLAWRELLFILRQHADSAILKDLLSEDLIAEWDGCLGIRLLNTNLETLKSAIYLISVLKKNQMLISEDVCLFIFGHEKEAIHNNKSMGEPEFRSLIDMMAIQPAVKQMLYPTTLIEQNFENFSANILALS